MYWWYELSDSRLVSCHFLNVFRLCFPLNGSYDDTCVWHSTYDTCIEITVNMEIGSIYDTKVYIDDTCKPGSTTGWLPRTENKAETFSSDIET